MTIQLKPDSYEKVVLGRVGISNYATQLKTEVAYTDGSANYTKSLLIRRQTQQQIKDSLRRWKGRKKNVPEFFPD